MKPTRKPKGNYANIPMKHKTKKKLYLLKIKYNFSSWEELFQALMRNNEKLVDLIK